MSEPDLGFRRDQSEQRLNKWLTVYLEGDWSALLNIDLKSKNHDALNQR